jgi:hypothetical protein
MMLAGRAVPLSAGDRRTLRFGISAVAIMLLVFKGAPALWAAERAARADAAQYRMAVTRTRRSLGEASASSDSRAMPRRFLIGTSPAVATARLAQLVEGAASEAGGQVGAVQLLSPQAVGDDIWRVGARVHLRATHESMVTVLFDLENGEWAVRVRELAISGGATSAQEEQGQLDITLTLDALAQRAEPRPDDIR